MSAFREKPRQRWVDLTPRSLIQVRDQLRAAHGFLYVFGAQAYVKVGMSKFDVYRRWHGIKTGNPWLEPPLYVNPPLMDRAALLEKACHTALKDYQVSGEWFNCPRELAIETVRRISHGA